MKNLIPALRSYSIPIWGLNASTSEQVTSLHIYGTDFYYFLSGYNLTIFLKLRVAGPGSNGNVASALECTCAQKTF